MVCRSWSCAMIIKLIQLDISTFCWATAEDSSCCMTEYQDRSPSKNVQSVCIIKRTELNKYSQGLTITSNKERHVTRVYKFWTHMCNTYHMVCVSKTMHCRSFECVYVCVHMRSECNKVFIFKIWGRPVYNAIILCAEDTRTRIQALASG